VNPDTPVPYWPAYLPDARPDVSRRYWPAAENALEEEPQPEA
jgi:hypothetical protein